MGRGVWEFFFPILILAFVFSLGVKHRGGAPGLKTPLCGKGGAPGRNKMLGGLWFFPLQTRGGKGGGNFLGPTPQVLEKRGGFTTTSGGRRPFPTREGGHKQKEGGFSQNP